ncbi:MAG: hypothetical protein IJ756_03070 [Paludibacteraceae bacterium]|nr:hypothetical protein [Paludibacteraceae bacterium]
MRKTLILNGLPMRSNLFQSSSCTLAMRSFTMRILGAILGATRFWI